MTKKLAVGDRVKIDDGNNRYEILEVEPEGVSPTAPSTYCVRMRKTGDDSNPELLFGNHRLTVVPD